MSKQSISFIFILWLVAISQQAFSGDSVSVTTHSLNTKMAMKLALETYQDCSSKGYNVAVAVVNREGRLLSFLRHPLAGIHTIDVSQGKAYTASTFKASTAQLAERQYMREIPGAMTWGGGRPINIGGIFYGAVGVAGAPARAVPGDVDDECAEQGIKAVTEAIEFADE